MPAVSAELVSPGCAREERRSSGSSQQCRVNRVDANTTGDRDGAQWENTVGKDFLHLQRAKVTWGSPSASERRDSIVHIIFKVVFQGSLPTAGGGTW